MNKVRVLDNRVAFKCHPEKEPQRRYSMIDRRLIRRAVLGEMQLKAPDILKARRVGWAARICTRGQSSPSAQETPE